MIRRLRQALRRRRSLRELRPTLHATPHEVSVPVGSLLIGDQAGRPLEDWVPATGDYARVSLPLLESPYYRFLQIVRGNPSQVDSNSFLQETEYYRMARLCMEHTGKWFGARTEEELLARVRSYACSLPETAEKAPPAKADERIRGKSLEDEPVSAFRIRESDCWELVDGHHRAALAALDGVSELTVLELGEKWSYLQRTALLGVQTRGRRELYQPVDTPEFGESWSLVRLCRDRFDMMERFLSERGWKEEGGSVLDLACSYGWFLSGFARMGFEPHGVELDHLSIEMGRAAYGLPVGVVQEGSAERFLKRNANQYDVVLFLSILHHFVLGREKAGRFGAGGSDPVAGILGALDRATRKVLFLDTGESHEEWFRAKLPGWTPEHVAAVLREHTTFSEVIPLGTDRDSERFPGNYGRTLFACVR